PASRRGRGRIGKPVRIRRGAAAVFGQAPGQAMPLPRGGKAVRGPTSRKPEDLPIERRQWCPGPGHAAGQARSARAEPSCVPGPTPLCPDRQEGCFRIMLASAAITRPAESPTTPVLTFFVLPLRLRVRGGSGRVAPERL